MGIAHINFGDLIELVALVAASVELLISSTVIAAGLFALLLHHQFVQEPLFSCFWWFNGLLRWQLSHLLGSL
jgi:hypothetical protein